MDVCSDVISNYGGRDGRDVRAFVLQGFSHNFYASLFVIFHPSTEWNEVENR